MPLICPILAHRRGHRTTPFSPDPHQLPQPPPPPACAPHPAAARAISGVSLWQFLEAAVCAAATSVRTVAGGARGRTSSSAAQSCRSTSASFTFGACCGRGGASQTPPGWSGAGPRGGATRWAGPDPGTVREGWKLKQGRDQEGRGRHLTRMAVTRQPRPRQRGGVREETVQGFGPDRDGVRAEGAGTAPKPEDKGQQDSSWGGALGTLWGFRGRNARWPRTGS